MDKFSGIGSSDINAIDDLFQQYKKNPEELDENWRAFFQGFEFALSNYEKQNLAVSAQSAFSAKEFAVVNLIQAYRQRGHLFTKTNPVRARRKYLPTLDIKNFGFSESDLDLKFAAGNEIGLGQVSLRKIVDFLELTYCRAIGAEFVFVRQPEEIEWLQRRMESSKNLPQFTVEQKKEIYAELVKAVGFEKFIHKKFVGQKRFSLEGGEALIPALDLAIQHGADLGIEDFVIGMSHRGRLNVLANTLQKPYENILHEFMGTSYDEFVALGDVKYHLGADTDILLPNGKSVNLSLAPNPSHLEMVGAVIQGIARAKIDHKHQRNYNKVAPIIIHGDAAISAQGIVYEITQMSKLAGYRTGGTIHLVVNNQVGFTTNYTEGRSSTYSTDIAKVTRSPVFHVNGDDVEAIVHVMIMAMDYRQKFHTDVFIDILGYRKFGHNEGDEPRFTQPLLYKTVANHPSVREIYADVLINQGIYTKTDIQQINQNFELMLEGRYELARKQEKVHIDQFLKSVWKDYHYPSDRDFREKTNTSISAERFRYLAHKVNELPADKTFFTKLVKLFGDRLSMLDNNKVDWAMAELVAYASLLTEGYSVRISGQDSERGTFSHRHAALRVEGSEEKYIPLKNLDQNQARFSIYNSLLSEYGVLGFEYGYALAHPKGFTVWEAQFGDFHNVAQPIIDQYIVSAEEKWGLLNGLALFLPHGFEGQGPEHSSARIERFLQLAVNNNIQVIYPSTPANIFHLIRRQMLRNFQVPLIVFTPKSLLRHPECISAVEDFTQNGFLELIDDANVDVSRVSRVVFCTGKIYYDLLAKKNEFNARDVALVRLEQLHPFPKNQIKDILKKYKNNLLTLWVQEEPENMGAWNYIRNNFTFADIEPVTRLASASPAVGLNKLHQIGQEEIVYKVFRKCDCELHNDYCGLQCVLGKSRKEILKQHRYLFENKNIATED
jgi:2-oxoglutarate dehydrogenase E1 component